MQGAVCQHTVAEHTREKQRTKRMQQRRIRESLQANFDPHLDEFNRQLLSRLQFW